jgi:CRISPR/Cas system-associated exonuclease Cas4 (RecB family)
MGVKLVELHHLEAAPGIAPETVQESFVLETDAGYDLEGTMDLTEKGGVIVDVKTSRAAYAENAIEKEFQPALYDFAYEKTRGKPARGFRYDVLVKPTSRQKPKLQRVEGKVNACDREWLFGTISQVHKAIQAGVALPAPEGSWYCSAKWCGYWNQCKGRKHT